MRRAAFIPVLLALAAVSSSASVATTGVRAKTKDRITSASNPPGVVKGLSPQRGAAQPMTELPGFIQDPTPFLTEFYGPAKVKTIKPEPEVAVPTVAPQAAVQDAPEAEKPQQQ